MPKILVYILIYFYIYKNLSFYPSPYFSYYNLFALMCCILNMKKFLIYKKFLRLFFIIFQMIIVYIISILINNSSIFLVNPLRILIIRLILDINFIIFINKYLGKNLYEKCNNFFKGFIFSCSIDIFLGLLRFKFELFDKIFLKIFPPRDTIIKEILNQKVRLMGVGGYFFGGGILLSISLILIMFLLVNTKLSKKEKVMLKVTYVFNFFLGMLISRTTILGLIFSFFYFKLNKKNILRALISFSILMILIMTIYMNLNLDIRNNIYKFLYIQGKGSLKRLLNMYSTFPKTLKTILIGDSLWENIDKSYYMHIDVGYIRLIFFNGILGLLLIVLFNYELSRINDLKLNKLSKILFILFLILNLKGDVPYIPVSIFLYVLDRLNKKGMYNEKS